MLAEYLDTSTDRMAKIYCYLEKLQEITKTLPKLEQVAKGYGTFKEYQCEKGFSVAVNIFWSPELAICKNWLSKTTIFPEHIHEEFEFVTVIVGRGILTIDGRSVEYTPMASFTLDPGTPHKWEALEDTVFLCISIPASPGFPDDGTHN